VMPKAAARPAFSSITSWIGSPDGMFSRE